MKLLRKSFKVDTNICCQKEKLLTDYLNLFCTKYGNIKITKSCFTKSNSQCAKC